MMEAINCILSKGIESCRYTIFSDSKSTSVLNTPMTTTSPISRKGCELLQKAQAENIHAEHCWASGHTNVEGNEKVEMTAKSEARDVNRITLD